MPKLEIHPAALAMPEASREDYERLLDDIEKHGQCVPIELYKGQIIDGRTRYKACLELKLEPWTVDAPNDLDGKTPAEYVWSLNVARRHLSQSQRSACGLAFLNQAAAEAGVRMMAGVSVEKDPSALLPKQDDDPSAFLRYPPTKAKASEEVAKMVGVSPRYIEMAKRVKDADPETFERLKNGDESLTAATKKLFSKPKNGSEVVTCDVRKELHKHFGGLRRSLDDAGIYENCRTSMEMILAEIKLV